MTINRIFVLLHIADGFALGAAVATGQGAVQVIVFFAVILHKVSFPEKNISVKYLVDLITNKM